MTLEAILYTLKRIRYKDWTFIVNSKGGTLYLQVRFNALDTATGEIRPQCGRKWMISQHMTRSEFVQTALKAVLAAEEHEAREQFTYADRAIFGPHYDVDALAAICGQEDRRPQPQAPSDMPALSPSR